MLGRVFDITAIRRRSGLHLLVLADDRTLSADLTCCQQSRNRAYLAAVHGVVDRRAGGLFLGLSHRCWLAVNVIGALAINHFILTNW